MSSPRRWSFVFLVALVTAYSVNFALRAAPAAAVCKSTQCKATSLPSSAQAVNT